MSGANIDPTGVTNHLGKISDDTKNGFNGSIDFVKAHYVATLIYTIAVVVMVFVMMWIVKKGYAWLMPTKPAVVSTTATVNYPTPTSVTGGVTPLAAPAASFTDGISNLQSQVDIATIDQGMNMAAIHANVPGFVAPITSLNEDPASASERAITADLTGGESS
jgi:hypothetical protein